MSGGTSGNFSSQLAKADRARDKSRQKKLIATISSQEGIDDITRAELIAQAKTSSKGKNRRSVEKLLDAAVEGRNPTFNERFRIQQISQMRRERPGIFGLLGR